MSRSRGVSEASREGDGSASAGRGVANASIRLAATGRGEQGVARGGDADRGDQVRARRVLEQEAARARAQRLVNVVV